MRSHLLYYGLLALLAGLTDGQYGGGFYFPDDSDDSNEEYRPWGRPNRPTPHRPSPQTRPSRPSSDSSTGLPLENCGKTQTQRIYGGDIASLGQFPWQALLQYRNGNGALSFECGGALIHRRYILTAAHCLHKDVIGKFNLVNVRLGEHDTSKQQDCVENENTNDKVCSDPPQNFGIERQVLHPQYSGQKESKFDIALLRLNRDAPTTNYIIPICLPIEENSRSTPGVMIASGWGFTESGLKSPVLRFVGLPHVDIGTCSTQLRKSFDSTQLCAGGENGKDSCNGDSGGPLIEAVNINNDSHFVIKGIVSFGPKRCGTEGKPAVYTRVSAFTDWILKTINA